VLENAAEEGHVTADVELEETVVDLGDEQVVAATPSASLSPKVLGEWQRRAELSIELVPIARTAFWAA
jgi:hypothetical protein